MLSVYRRHRQNCKAAHVHNTRTSEYDERKKGWRRCECPVFVSGTLQGVFKRQNTGEWEWDRAHTVAKQWDATGSWTTKPAPLPAPPPEPEQTGRITLADAVKVFLTSREGAKIAAPTLRKYKPFTRQLTAFAGKPESPDSNVDQCQRVNSRWDWTLMNSSVAAAQVHPFHIHINPFQIMEISYIDAQGKPAVYTPKGPPIWSDVVSIPQSGFVRIRQAFDDFTGTYVLHCHILAHEDRGMMQLVRTIPANADPATACKLNGVQHH